MTDKYEFIDSEKDTYPVVRMLAWMSVSKSGFYEWRGRPDSATTSRRADLKALKNERQHRQTVGDRMAEIAGHEFAEPEPELHRHRPVQSELLPQQFSLRRVGAVAEHDLNRVAGKQAHQREDRDGDQQQRR